MNAQQRAGRLPGSGGRIGIEAAFEPAQHWSTRQMQLSARLDAAACRGLVARRNPAIPNLLKHRMRKPADPARQNIRRVRARCPSGGARHVSSGAANVRRTTTRPFISKTMRRRRTGSTAIELEVRIAARCFADPGAAADRAASGDRARHAAGARWRRADAEIGGDRWASAGAHRICRDAQEPHHRSSRRRAASCSKLT